MEATLAANDDFLIGGLQWKLPESATYITNRRSSTTHVSGGNQYSNTGVTLLRFEMSDLSAYADPHTLQLSFSITNTSADKALQFHTSNPLILFQRLRILLGAGTLCEDHAYYSRVVAMQDHFIDPYKRVQLYGRSGLGVATDGDPNALSASLAPGKTRKVTCPLLCGLTSQTSYIPLKYCQIHIELQLQSDNTNCCVATEAANVSGSTSFALSDARILCDVVELDGELNEKISRHLMSGKSLNLAMASWNTTLNIIAPSDGFAVQLQRAFSRVKSVFVTFSDEAGDGNNTRQFLHPLKNAAYDPDKDTFEFYLQVGSTRMPDFNVKSISEAWYQFTKSLNMLGSVETVSIPPSAYTNNKFIIGMDLEKAAVGPGAGAAY